MITQKDVKCPYCRQISAYEIDTTYHVQNHLQGACSHCGKVFKFQAILEVKIRNVKRIDIKKIIGNLF